MDVVSRYRLFATILIVLGLGSRLRGDEPSLAESPAAAQARIVALIADLDSPHFRARRDAVTEIEAMTRRPDLKSLLSAELDRALLDENLSFEARACLAPLVERLPTAVVEPEQPLTAELVARFVADMQSDSPGVRAAAEARLKRAAAQTENSIPMMAVFKSQLARPELDPTTRKIVRDLLERARGVWLLSDSTTWDLPNVPDSQIQGWIRDLAQKTPDELKDRVRHEHARRELLDLLARDEYVDRVRKMLTEYSTSDVEALRRIEDVVDWTKPAMVAEFWQANQHVAIQYLIVGVPSVPEGAQRASYFDRIDDQTAHCVSGNSLSPGDHPVGVFFPHPLQGSSQFQLVNLPTPRKRLMYEFQVQGSDHERAKAITTRTLERLLALRKPLSVADILMIEELDDGDVSAFTGQYFMKVDDGFYTGIEGQMVGNVSRHQNLCCMLARSGRQTAIPGLMAAIQAKRFADPPQETPYQWPWVAALCIAVHDPWPEVDEWLAGLVEKTEPLYVKKATTDTPPPPDGNPVVVAPIPELGATAASILISRHNIPPSVFGVEVLMYTPLASLECPSSYFRNPGDRERVLAWWSKQKEQPTDQRPVAAPTD